MRSNFEELAFKEVRKFKRRTERFNPTFWLFVIGVAILLAGLVFPNSSFLIATGGFIVGLYILIAVVWIIFTVVEN